MISIVAAMAQNRVIGRGDDIPWHISEDFLRVKKLTWGHPIIMGRKTYESMLTIRKARKFKEGENPNILPGRTNIVLTSDANYTMEGVLVANSIERALTLAKNSPGDEEIFILGGANVFEQALPFAHKLYMTVIHEDVEGDVYFPQIDEVEWSRVKVEKRKIKFKDINFSYSFVDYIKVGEEINCL